MKQCSKCNVTKPYDDYHKKTSSKDGYRSVCRSCRILERKTHYNKNKARISDYNTQYRITHSDELSNYRQRTRDIKRVYNRLYIQNNRDKCNAKTAKRRTDKRNQTPTLDCTEKFMIEGLYFISQVLSNSCGEQFHIDHIHPISKGGLHTFDNLQILSAEENLKKGARHS